jgi:tripartite-type tricarboxylate transporter receptor subunit TctC
MDEAGVQGLDVDSWIGLFAPAGTPKAAIEKLQQEITASAPELKAKFVAVGGDWIGVPSDQLDSFVRAETDKWNKLIKEAGISLE